MLVVDRKRGWFWWDQSTDDISTIGYGMLKVVQLVCMRSESANTKVREGWDGLQILWGLHVIRGWRGWRRQYSFRD
jgi:hypothetical protein